jgi:hypothetical protein
MTLPIAGKQYTVVIGDSLSKIAARAYGDYNLWPRIYKANQATLRSGNPNLIYPGEILIIPLLAEIDDNLRVFKQYLENPDFPTWSFEKLEGIRKSGLFEFVKNHNRKLGDKLILLYENIYPRLGKLNELQQETKKQICEIWTEHIGSLLSDTKAKTHSGTFVNFLFANGLYIMLLKGEVGKGSGIWYEQASQMAERFNLYTSIVQEKGRMLVSHNAKISSFAPSSNELETLERLSQAKVQKLLNYYNQTKNLLDKEVVNGLIP